ncbi:hypothetical protein Rhe02_33160 [Rhizocola hellebori]|uniref:Cytochrome c biogenesis protein CcdA n=1 Tax=Rhizocola hellebori TaxID=1392758 RepID=A0A8J3Q787_9ACTN|nr:cytochrome c biogenesis CcdA family protein [Rhizocola hellebori]GIH05249.1 hypothetical protein Rhe02_33160 [Rhizocola hellebori]
MADAPYPLAVAAGMLAAVNPCGFALLPAYVSLLVVDGNDSSRSAWRKTGTALAMTAAMTAGFVGVFGAFGLLATPVADQLMQHAPWMTIAIGLILTGLGLWMATGRDLPSPVPKAGQAPQLTRRFWSMAVFGAAFAIASLSCTIGPFLLVVAMTFRAETISEGIGLFVAYAAGMALIVGTVAIAVALAQQSVLGWLRRAGPVLSRVAGGLMTAAGAYVAWYGWYEVRLSDRPGATDPVVTAAGEVQTWLATQVEGIGPAAFAMLAAVLAAAVLAAAKLRRP